MTPPPPSEVRIKRQARAVFTFTAAFAGGWLVEQWPGAVQMLAWLLLAYLCAIAAAEMIGLALKGGDQR